MSSRYLLTLALLLLAATAQGMTPARHGANGGGSCPEAHAEAAAEAAAAPSPVLAAGGAEADATAAPNAAPAPAKAANGSRVKPGTRWHSFLPGMFK
jgi:hypothetical protein